VEIRPRAGWPRIHLELPQVCRSLADPIQAGDKCGHQVSVPLGVVSFAAGDCLLKLHLIEKTVLVLNVTSLARGNTFGMKSGVMEPL